MTAIPKAIHVDSAGVLRMLRRFEAASESALGERLGSDEFYRRYRAGEFDHPFGMVWSSFYEAAERIGAGEDEAGLDRMIRDLAAV